MPRDKFQTLTEQMFYILLCLQQECCGVDIMDKIRKITSGRVVVGPGTLYSLLASFQKSDMITETSVDGRKRWYILTDKGMELLYEEYSRITLQARDYEAIIGYQKNNKMPIESNIGVVK